ncbi:MAG: DUF302 domain-containing protein [Bacteroidales bacterium]
MESNISSFAWFIEKIIIMSYYFSTILKKTTYEQAIELATAELQKEGFGVLTQINVKETLKKKIDVDFRPYIILGACNPHFAHKALLAEDKLGAFLPCNVVVEQHDDGTVEVSAVDPHAMMASVTNPKLEELAGEVREKMQKVIKGIANHE